MAEFKIPVTRASRNYSFQANMDGINYKFKIRYNRRMNSWIMDINDEVHGIHLVGGVDVLAQHKHNNIPQGEMRLVDLEGQGRDPQLETFGDSIILTYAEPV
jgi:hypothetical protein